MRNLVLETAEKTAALVKYENLLISGTSIYNNYQKFQDSIQKINDLETTRDELQNKQLLDDLDKSYLDWAIKSEQWNYWSSFFSVFGAIAKSFGLDNTDKLSYLKYLEESHKIADSIKSATFTAHDFFAEQEIRKDYMKLKYSYYQQNQIIISGLSSFLDSAAEEVGNYLIRARSDVVTKKPDGSIEVRIDGVVYPPKQ